MQKRLLVSELKVGMYIILPSSWLSHDFIKSQFKIDSPELLQKVQYQKLKHVTVDYEKSDRFESAISDEPTVEELAYISHNDTVKDPKHESAPEGWSSRSVVPEELIAAIEDKKLSPDKKSAAVYSHSIEMMEHLLESPTAENINASKQAISSITDLILSDDKTADSLLRITAHDFYTYTHSVNVGVTGLMLSKALFKNSDAHDLHELGAGFFLHDLGKVKVDPDVLNKPARLTESEMRHVRIHPYQGYKILNDANALSEECRLIIMQHHEFVDGTGYPRKLKDNEIHIYGKICGIADVFDALTAERSYKKAMSTFDALTLMKEKMITHFDKELFGSFVRLF
ncbi:MAG: HD-GYP domain-containing protein [Chromatiales bacterium]|nr:HD-GYP domain-containing protein [Chromatiales bacterium]